MPLSKSIKKTEAFAAHYVAGLSPKKNSATIIGLSGDLGSGKTAFVKAVAKALKVRNTITSPTFVIEKIYSLPKLNKFSKLVHIDAYRLKGAKEFKSIFKDDVANDPKALVFIEWPGNVKKGLPKKIKKINFKFIDNTTRKITWHKKNQKKSKKQ